MNRSTSLFLAGLLSASLFLLLLQVSGTLPPTPVATLPDGSQYHGELRDNIIHGRGVLLRPDGARYEGEFKQGLFHGRGNYRLGDGSHYRGDFEQGLYHGSGSLQHHSGARYDGEFRRGLFHGQGLYIGAGGEEYSGPFVDGQFSGEGSYRDGDGNRYLGQFENWQFHGQGSYFDAEGNQYRGEFSNDSLNGEGEFLGADGEHYRGEFASGLYHGHGRQRTAEGDIYEGQFRYGKRHGEGNIQYAEALDGIAQLSGQWRAGQLLSSDDPRLPAVEAQTEQLLYAQNTLLDSQADDLLAADPARIELYFLGVAGDGGQGVFRREVQAVRDYFDRQLGTAGRSSVLINSRLDAGAQPLATRESLARALRHIAARMNREQDILFLYLSSHGSSDAQFQLAQPGLSLPSLSADELKTMLDESGVRWKVLVISACYSGSFIPSLRDEHTLIITAAAADKTSFGCSDRAEYTYFGEAYFKDALPQAGSFVEAFEQAVALVKQREEEQNYEHSQPQLHRSAKIERQLARWRAQPSTSLAQGE